MANNQLNQNENILVLVDQQNIIHIDPNTVVSSSGELLPRFVDHENLVMYVNLEADLVPRTTLYSETETNNTFTSIARGKFNLLRNQDDAGDKLKDNYFDTNWTETFVSNNNITLNATTGENTIYDPTAQTFGIESINIVTKGANNIPQVSINFIDVRGKTLFDAPQNSPYKAFFHQPWPIFYLTVKGFYGKAVRYRIQMVDFKSKFNGNTGNFEITTKFVGSSYAFLNDILLQNAVNAPYLYMVETSDPYKLNEKTGYIEKKVSKTTKGYTTLKSVYNEYKAKGYIPFDFPNKTLRDLFMTATALDSIVEKKLFSETVEPSVLSDVAQYDKELSKFERTIIQWGSRYLNSSDEITQEVLSFPGIGENVTVKYYNLNKISNNQSKTTSGPVSLDIITGTTNTNSLQYKINEYIDKLEKNSAFGKDVKSNLEVKTKRISLDAVRNVGDFYKVVNSKVGVSTEKLVNTIKKIQNTFIKERDKVENIVETKMNQIISDKKEGFGFSPTIRNIFAVILANAETHIRLMSDVHNKAIKKSELRKKEIKLSPQSKSDEKEMIYAWPEVKKNGKDDKLTYFYPADSDIVGLTKGNNYNLWPEVEFVETYNSVAVKRVDTGTSKEISTSDISFVFEDDKDLTGVFNVSTALNIGDIFSSQPYINKPIPHVVYEIYERANIATSYDNFAYGSGLEELVKAEFNNISGATEADMDIRSVLSTEIKSYSNLVEALQKFSPIERYPYYQDNLPTVDYIKNIVDIDFKIQEYSGATQDRGVKDVDYAKIQNAIANYDIPEYRFNEFPFATDLYKKYLGNRNLKASDFKYQNILTNNSNENFISSPIDPKAWVYSATTKNMFINEISYSGFTRNLLNTPYFHRQLYSDFFKGGVNARYAGSAYILLNSLPYKDLDDELDFSGNKVVMSSLFKEIGATHYVPYYLMLKWGAIYHRYKRWLVDGVDILSGVTTPISGATFFDNATSASFNLTGNTTPDQISITNTITGATFNSGLYVGLYPYYHGLYSQIVNGYSFYNPSGFTKTSATVVNASNEYAAAVASGFTKFVVSKPTNNSGITFTCLVDNSKFSTTDKRYTILPSFNANQINDLVNNFSSLTQDSFRIIYDSNNLNTNPSYNVAYFPDYGEKFETDAGVYSLSGTKKKVVDLVAVFSPKILDDFEKMFIEFSSLDLDLDTPNKTRLKYNSFQQFLKEITSVDNAGIDFTTPGYANKIKENQTKKLEQITIDILDNNFLNRISIGNPKQIDNYIISGYLGKAKTYVTSNYNISQLTTANKNLIELYIGQPIEFSTYTGVSTNPEKNIYVDFFKVSNIAVTPDNIYTHRELARIYAGWVKSKTIASPNYTDFKNYLLNQIYNPQQARLQDFLNNLTGKFEKGLAEQSSKNNVTIYHGYNESKTTLLDLYQFFKSFNDKWVAGNAINQRNLMDEFLFLDRANRDIGNEAFISLERLISLADEKNIKIDLYSAISVLLQGTNFDVRPLPAYVNFYGTNSTNKKRIVPSKNLARNLFGTHLDVDYQDSSPKIIIQYIGKTSQYLDMEKVSKQYKFKNDGFDIKNPNNNPLLIEPKIFMDTDISKSNRVVSFEINFGDQTQNIFKNISLDQSTYKNTTESALAQERLARSQGGGGSHAVDIGLFDIYKTASYQCNVTCMGNAMIQPTMYFYLANVPMFAGTYLVFDVTHSIKQGGFETSFTGVRISNTSLPSLDNSFMSSYRPLFSRVLSAAVKKKQAQDDATKVKTEQTLITNNNKTVTVDPGPTVPGEDIKSILAKESGFLFTDLIPYNGQAINGISEQYIQLINFKDKQWLRTRVCVLGSGKYTPMASGSPAELSMVSAWAAYPNKIIKLADIGATFEYYSIRANVTNKNKETLFKYNTLFYNPQNKVEYTLQTDVNPNNNLFDGPVHNGPSIGDPSYKQFGVALSATLMRKLRLAEGDVIYIRYE